MSNEQTGAEKRGRGPLARASRALVESGPGRITAVLIVLVVFFSVANPDFGSAFNLLNILDDTAILLVMAVGQTFVMITAGIDLSVGSVLVFSGVVTAKVMGAGGGSVAAGGEGGQIGPVTLGIVVGLLAGLGWGLVNGILVAKLNLPPLIVTLGTLGMALGLSQIITSGVDLSGIPKIFTSSVGFGRVLYVPNLVIIAAIVAIIGGVALARTRYGRYTYAIGSNIEAARRAAIPVNRHVISVYALQGLLAGLAGVLSLAHFTTTTIGAHASDNLEVISGVVLGGTSLFGGFGSIFRTVLGTLIPVVLASGLLIIGVQSFWQTVVIGAILIVAVFFDQLQRRSRERGGRRRKAEDDDIGDVAQPSVGA